MSTKLNGLTIAAARDGLAGGDFSSVELTEACLSAMEGRRDLNAFITETPDIARDRAAQSDARRSKGELRGGMDGIPVAVKDLFCTEG
ncbi:MAG: amidase family protein, partial [Rhodospirillales bacterium]|nr:amidase family protein [Rhodospirillales bacterium]